VNFSRSLKSLGENPPWKTPRYAPAQHIAMPHTVVSHIGIGVTSARGSLCSRLIAPCTSVTVRCFPIINAFRAKAWV